MVQKKLLVDFKVKKENPIRNQQTYVQKQIEPQTDSKFSDKLLSLSKLCLLGECESICVKN